MTSTNLENLVKINQLKPEPPDQAQIDGMIRSAKNRLADLRIEGLSDDGRFLSAYGAAHALWLARKSHRFPTAAPAKRTVTRRTPAGPLNVV